ncbi:MAG TPA: lysophospholipid acyltransferase family protein [Polyangia bacterium]|nr:lysophospholipid acyltransferase family protein [Polyangia bacterium]
MLAFVAITLVLAVAAIFSFIKDRSGDTVLRLARVWARAIMFAAGVKLTIRTARPLDPRRPYVFMANHLSASDIFSLFIAIPFPVRMISKKQLGRIPFFGWAMHAGRFIFIDRQNPMAARRSIEEAARRIHSGQSVMLFPEGTRSRDGYLGPFKKGGFHLAIASGADIVPCGLRGTREVMRRGSLLIYPGAITVDVGAPISTEGLTDADRDALLERVRNQIREMTGQDDRPPEPGSLDRGSASRA